MKTMQVSTHSGKVMEMFYEVENTVNMQDKYSTFYFEIWSPAENVQQAFKKNLFISAI